MVDAVHVDARVDEFGLRVHIYIYIYIYREREREREVEERGAGYT